MSVTRAKRLAQVQALQAQGLSPLEIVRETALSRSYVYGLLDDPTGAEDRKRKRRYEHPCPECGTTVNPNGLRNPNGLCAPCRKRVDTQRSHEWLISEAHRFVEMYGRPPRAWEWSRAQAVAAGKSVPAGGWPAVNTAQHQFGSWRRFLKAAGYDAAKQGGNSGGPGSLSAEELARTVALRERFTLEATAEILGISANAVTLRCRKAREGTVAAPVKPTAVIDREIEKYQARIETLRGQLAEAEDDVKQLEAAKAALRNGRAN